ncbi:hypothetical protein GTU73_18775 [Rathayibacter sp. VKM Ac-2804]|uniref:hypothetical protein n=1 Tax=Rathayibacter sp. VKM Ac-2804 TaxID=2609257 RepID=UPI00132E948F|nr:hypothetical protein [Rathayibacter sp. VKM Ac-2804]QHF25838.1 hypothetical protein GTU73_18775 [Rathayibacter sp. VKM Ac-2804]
MRADDTPPDHGTDPVEVSTPAEVCVTALRRIAEGAPTDAEHPAVPDPSGGGGAARVHRWHRTLLHHGAFSHCETGPDGLRLLRTPVGVVAVVIEPGRVVTVPGDCCQIVNATLSAELDLRSERRRTVLSAHSLLDEAPPAGVRHLLPGIRTYSVDPGTVLTLALELLARPTGSAAQS